MRVAFACLVLGIISSWAGAQPSTQPVKLPFLDVDAPNKTIRLACEAIGCRNPLEFFLCAAGTAEHESVLRSKVKPSHLHAALLMLGLTPGEPVRFSESKRIWLAPHGPALRMTVVFQRDGKQVEFPAHRLMRDIRSKRPMPAMNWIFTGSRVREDGTYAADQTGYLITVVNFDLTVIDIPQLASNANESLMWEVDPEVALPAGKKVTRVIRPADSDNAPATQGSGRPPAIDQPTTNP